jgi:hypothetical protein
MCCLPWSDLLFLGLYQRLPPESTIFDVAPHPLENESLVSRNNVSSSQNSHCQLHGSFLIMCLLVSMPEKSVTDLINPLNNPI